MWSEDISWKIISGASLLLLLFQLHLPRSRGRDHASTGWVLPALLLTHHNWSSTTCSDGVWLLLRSLGRHCPCAGSLPGCCGCLPAGWHIACLLSGKVWHSNTLLIAFSLWLNAWPLRMVATEKREWYELSDHWQGIRMVTNCLQLDAHLSNKCVSSNCSSDGEHEISARGRQFSKLVGHHKLFLLYTVTHPCFCSFSALPGTHSGYFDKSIANQIKDSSHQVYHWL